MLRAYRKQSDEIITVFQPHTYSRTKLLIDDFINCFENCSPLIIYKTYPAREKYDKNGSAKTLFKNLLKKAKINNKKVHYAKDAKELETLLKRVSSKYKTVLFLGAGDIYDIAKQIVIKNQ